MATASQTRAALNFTRRLMCAVACNINSFEVLSKDLLPYGLKPHTRSICWLAEQVLTQYLRKNARGLKIDKVIEPKSDIGVYDIRYVSKNIPLKANIYVNIKVSAAKTNQKNDIASVKSLLSFLKDNPNVVLLCVVFKFTFDNNRIVFEKNPIVFNYAWMDDFVVNPRNEHIQALYNCGECERTQSEFVKLVLTKARKKNLKV